MDKKAAIILINYRDYAKRFLAEAINSLREQTYPGELIKVYIVDNASTAESREYLKIQCPEATIIARPDGNYCAANNAGIRQGISDGCDYLVIANMDVKFDKDWLRELAVAAENSDAGAVQSKILLYPKTEAERKNPLINSLGNVFHYLGFGYTDGYNSPDREIYGLPEIKGYGSGCSLLLKRGTVERIGGYNEEYYMYHDDVEIGWKMKLAGLKTILAPESVICHKYDFGRSVKMVYYMERNRYLAVFSFYELKTLILLMPALIAMDLGMLFYSLINGWLKAKLDVYIYFLNSSTWKKIKAARREAEKIRVKKDSQITADFSGKVLFQEIENPVLKHIANPLFSIYWHIVKNIIKAQQSSIEQ